MCQGDIKELYKSRARLHRNNGSVIPAANPIRLSVVLRLVSKCFLYYCVYYWLVLGSFQALWAKIRGILAVYGIPVDFYPFWSRLLGFFWSLLPLLRSARTGILIMLLSTA